MRRLSWFLWVFAGAALVAAVGASTAGAQTNGAIVVTLPADMDRAEREALVEALTASERPVTVDAGPADASAAAAKGQVTTAMAHWDAALASWRELPALVARWWLNLSPQTTEGASLWVVGAIVVALLAGLGFQWALDRVLEGWRRRCSQAAPARFSERVGFLLARAGLEVLGILAFAAGTLLIGWLLLPAAATPRLTLAVTVAAIVKARLVLAIVRFIIAPDHPALRLAPMPDADARLVWCWVAASVVVIAAAYGARDLLVSAGATLELAVLLGIVVAAVAALVRLLAIFRVRRPLGDLLLRAYGSNGKSASRPVRLFADLWHIVFSILVIIDFVGTCYAQLVEPEAGLASLAVGSFLVLSLVPFAVGGYAALVDDLLLSRDDAGMAAGAAGALKAFGQGLIMLAAFGFLARAWGADPFAGSEGHLLSQLAAAALQIGGAALLGWTIWQGSKLALDHYASREPEGDGEVSEDAMGKPGSRIATVLPVIRAFLFVAILTVSILMALAALGINIGPLLAGAGVIGLAVGFGAQTLVKDIITGIFYLAEDAFRKGEYIECSAGKGVVEKISLRSVQLRHHNGPLHTVPFGSMGNITNHSRDWVRVKFNIRVPFDTDLNKMRKAVKKVGEEMRADPELGPFFLQPLKSQGVVDTDETGFITSVKFMSRPGEQFILRREAFSRIQRAFRENGIVFASPRVTVDAADQDDAAAAAASAASKFA